MARKNAERECVKINHAGQKSLTAFLALP